MNKAFLNNKIIYVLDIMDFYRLLWTQKAELFVWWREGDLNPRPRDYDSRALPAELPRHTEGILHKNPLKIKVKPF